MLRKEGSLGVRAYTVLLASVSLVGLCACSTQTPNTPQTPQQPVVVNPVTTQPSSTTPTAVAATYVITGRKFIDQDGNRLFSSTDTGEAGWNIRLYPSSVMQTNAWSTPLASTTTDANGNFTFSGVPGGTYLVVSAAQGTTTNLQQITPASTSYAQCVTLPQAATGCQQVAYQVTVDNSCPQVTDLSFMDQGLYGGYGAGCASPYGTYGYPYGAYGAGCVSPYGAYGAGCVSPYGAYGYPYGVYAYPDVVPILVVNTPYDDYDYHHHNCDDNDATHSCH